MTTILADIDLQIDQGDDFSWTSLPWLVNGSPQNLTGYTAVCKFRWSYTDVAAVLALSSTPNGNGSAVTPNTTAGTTTLTLAHADTIMLPTQPPPGNPGWMHWQIDLTSPGGAVTPLIRGRAFLNPTPNR